MAWKEPSERHSDDTITAIHHAANRIATAITEGFKYMADTEAQAIADLQQVVSDIGAAIATEIIALQAAMNSQGVNNSPAIENSVAKMRSLVGTLNGSIAPPAPAVSVPALSSVSPSSGPVAGGTKAILTGTGLTGATGVTFSSIAAASFVVNSDTQITAVAPAGALGVGLPVRVTTPGGQSALGPTWDFV